MLRWICVECFFGQAEVVFTPPKFNTYPLKKGGTRRLYFCRTPIGLRGNFSWANSLLNFGRVNWNTRKPANENIEFFSCLPVEKVPMMLVGVDELFLFWGARLAYFFRGAMAVGFMECFSVLEALNEHTVTPMWPPFLFAFSFFDVDTSSGLRSSRQLDGSSRVFFKLQKIHRKKRWLQIFPEVALPQRFRPRSGLSQNPWQATCCHRGFGWHGHFLQVQVDLDPANTLPVVYRRPARFIFMVRMGPLMARECSHFEATGLLWCFHGFYLLFHLPLTLQ